MGHFSPYLQFGPLVFDIPTMVSTLVAAALVVLIVFLATRRLQEIPQGMQNFLEWVIDFTRGIALQFMDHKRASRFISLALTLLLFIFISNQIGLFVYVWTEQDHAAPGIGLTEELLHEYEESGDHLSVTWWKSPTANPSVTFALATMVLLYSHWVGIKRSPGKYLKQYIQPHPLMFIINLIEEVSKFLTMPLRLFGNILAGEVLISFLIAGGLIAKAALSLPLFVWLGYSIFVGAIQAYIFVTLTFVYIGHKIEDAH